MKILVLGANGKVGSGVARELIARGHTVVAGIHRNKDAVPAQASIITIDIHDKDSIVKALTSIDVVICALSSWGAPKKNVLSTAMETVIPAMEQVGVKRIISVSGDVARLPGETPSLLTRLFHLMAFGPIRDIVHDSENHLQQLSNSHLDWTVLRPTTMTTNPHAGYKLQLTHPVSPLIPRAAVIASIVDLAETNSYLHEAPFISRA